MSPVQTASRRVRALTARGPAWAPIAAAGVVIAVITWPLASLYPAPGLDPSWRLALHLWIDRGLDAGQDVVFTFGPLGFLKEPLLLDAWLARLSWGYTLLIQVGAALALVWALSAGLRSVLLGAAAALVLMPQVVDEPVLALAAVPAVAMIGGRMPARWAPVVAAGLGALAGIEVLAKLSTGVSVLVVGGIGALMAGRRATAAFFAGGLLAAAVGWLAAGQALGAIPSWVRGSVEIVSGYDEAMISTEPNRGWELPVIIAVGALGAVAAWLVSRGLAGRRRLAVVALWSLLVLSAFKAGFVRHDGLHSPLAFEAALVGVVALAPLASRRLVVVALCVLAVVPVYASRDENLLDDRNAVMRVRQLGDQLRTLASPARTSTTIGRSQDALGAAYGMSKPIYDLLRGRTVHVDPWETGLVHAYTLDWEPLPVLQTYAAFTPYLDDRNADALSTLDRPERILRRLETPIDGRVAAWDSPAAMRAMLCHYAELRSEGIYQVLRQAVGRCGRPRLIGQARGGWGETLQVPPAPPGTALYAEVDGVQVSGMERLRALVYRPLTREVVINGDRRHRLVAATADQGLLLQVPPTVDFSGGFSLNVAANTLAFLKGTREQSGGDIRVRFYAMPVRPGSVP